MENERQFSGQNEEEVWQKIRADLAQKKDILDYQATIRQQNRTVELRVDIDLGGGFESGISTTRFKAALPTTDEFKFKIYEQGLLSEVGKLFGMQDVKIGYEDFDAKFIIQTNDEERVKVLFADETTRTTLLAVADSVLSNLTFEINIPDYLDAAFTEKTLELSVEEGIMDPAQLQAMYHVFMRVLTVLDPPALH
ncbi:hypothetical protein GCM10027275_48270 [Rhabdobacter roseus]|uniref:Uncharacterized protein n=1 Tax=Rhabdobacter roseus TaxID=1655419 RepID=A0A840U471_9BACT|nr:hypothetical protein [Rhabdobacter roseus]MBB5286890.1 hypothetical protein [Rhabdobacter roseus]